MSPALIGGSFGGPRNWGIGRILTDGVALAQER